MKNLLYVIIILVFPLLATSQALEIEGKLKVTEMDNVNTENHLVVKQPDGTLATRMVASLPPPPDTTRTLQSDLLLTSALCNCPSLPPAMIQSLLNNGYSNQDLVDFQISIPDLLAAGVTIPDLLAADVSVSDLLAADVSIQDLLDANLTPLNAYKGGVILDSLYGKTYEGGLIFYLDTITGDGLVSATSDQDTIAQWGCSRITIGGTNGAIGTGQTNTTAIVNGCGDSGIAAKLCDDLVVGIYDDWYLPSKDELNEIWLNLADSDGNGTNNGPSDPNNIGDFEASVYWNSTEVDRDYARKHNFFNGSQSFSNLKGDRLRVRAIRAF